MPERVPGLSRFQSHSPGDVERYGDAPACRAGAIGPLGSTPSIPTRREVSSGCSSAWKSACLGCTRPSVQIRPSRFLFVLYLGVAQPGRAHGSDP